MQVKVGTFTQDTDGTGSQAITGVGFQGKVLFLWANSKTADGSDAEVWAQSFGWAVSASEEAVIGTAFKNTSGNRGSTYTSSAACIAIQGGTNGINHLARADFTQWDSNGFTINWAVNDNVARKIHYMVLGGSEISAKSITTTVGTISTGNKAYTGFGFQPQFVMVLHPSGATVEGQNSTQRGMNLGAADGTRQIASGLTHIDTTSTSYENIFTNRTWHRNSVVTDYATFYSFDSDGYTLNWIDPCSATTSLFHALCIRGVKAYVGQDSQKTSSGTKENSAVGFPPLGLLFFGINNSTNNATPQSSTSMNFPMIGGSDGTNEAAIAGGRNSTTVTNNVLDSDKAVIHYATGASGMTLQAEADVNSLDSDGFTLNWPTADSTARIFNFIAFGDTNVTSTVAASFKKLTAAASVTKTGTEGAAAVSLKKLTAAANLSHPYIGAIAASLKKLTAAAAISHPYIGTIVATLPKLQTESEVSKAYLSTVAATLGKLVATAEASHPLVSGVAGTLQSPIASAIAIHSQLATIAAILPKLQSESEALHGANFVAATLPSLTAAGSITQTHIGIVTASLQKLVATVEAAMYTPVTGNVAASLKKLTVAAESIHSHNGIVAANLQKLTSSSTGNIFTLVSAGAILPKLQSNSIVQQEILGTVEATLSHLTAISVALQIITGNAAATLNNLTSNSTTNVVVIGEIAASLKKLVAAGVITKIFATTVTATLNNLTASGTLNVVVLGQVSASLKKLVGTAAVTQTIPSTVVATFPKLGAFARGGIPILSEAACTLKPLTCSAVAGGAILAIINLVASFDPTLQLLASYEPNIAKQAGNEHNISLLASY